VKVATIPFEFATASYLTSISALKASTLAQLRDGLRSCSDESIFAHTFQSLGEHHYLTEGFSNDFAQWVLAACNRPDLAEQLSAIDVREFVSLKDLRAEMRRVVGDYCRTHKRDARAPSYEPFYFCESIEVPIPLRRCASTLQEFHDCVASLSGTSFYYHFLSSRLRTHLKTNDFSLWLSKEMGLTSLADRIARIDIYTHTRESARATILRLVERELENERNS